METAKKKFPKNQGLGALKNQVGRLETKVEELNHVLKNEDNWNSVVTGWIGKKVLINLTNGGSIVGPLLWIDRYTLSVKPTGENVTTSDPYVAEAKLPGQTIVSKGALVSISLFPEE